MADNFEDEARRRPKSRNLRPLVRLAPYLMRYKPRVAMALVALLAAAIATLAVPLAVRRVIDHGFTQESAALVNQYFLAMLAVVAILAVSSAIRFYFVMWLGEKVVADLRSDLFSHLLKLSPGFYENQRTGEVVSRLTADTTQIKSAFSSTASILLRNAVMFIGAAFMMVATSPRLAGLGLLAVPLAVLPLVIYGRRVRSLSRAAQDTLASSAAFAQERLSAITAVQSNVQEAHMSGAFSSETDAAFSAAASRTMARSILTAAIIFVAMGAIVGLLWFGAREVIMGRLTGGTLSQFVIYAVLMASSLGQLSEVWGETQLAAGAAERISELLDERPAIASPPASLPLPSPPKGEVGFEDVSFAYAGRPDAPVLHNVSFVITPGETVAVVGPSGAGKTTIFALIERFYDPQKGRIMIDGLDVRQADLTELRRRIAVVPQDPVLFSGSIADNIRFGRPEAGHAEVAAGSLEALSEVGAVAALMEVQAMPTRRQRPLRKFQSNQYPVRRLRERGLTHCAPVGTHNPRCARL
ncbi:MAG: ATP-binding cassette domain-containing protein [Rhizobiales bacterium]|nr:ATP-binding cassette domain-containing protein [Hyphomicrobiales bacterium]